MLKEKGAQKFLKDTIVDINAEIKGLQEIYVKNKNFKEEKILKQIQTCCEIFQFPEKAEILLELRLN